MIARLLRDQRKVVLVAAVLAVASFWIVGQLGGWRLAGALAIGIGLGLVNHLASELWLLRLITNGDQPSRGAITRAAVSRLVALTAVALLIAVLLWPDGVGVLLGLAIFRLLAWVMTAIPLLRELQKEHA